MCKIDVFGGKRRGKKSISRAAEIVGDEPFDYYASIKRAFAIIVVTKCRVFLRTPQLPPSPSLFNNNYYYLVIIVIIVVIV